MRTIPAPPPATDDLDIPRLVLRDGTVASVRTAGAADRDALGRCQRPLSGQGDSATLLLERLALHAASYGFRRFHATR